MNAAYYAMPDAMVMCLLLIKYFKNDHCNLLNHREKFAFGELFIGNDRMFIYV